MTSASLSASQNMRKARVPLVRKDIRDNKGDGNYHEYRGDIHVKIFVISVSVL